jgi:hypothetical protein
LRIDATLEYVPLTLLQDLEIAQIFDPALSHGLKAVSHRFSSLSVPGGVDGTWPSSPAIHLDAFPLRVAERC